jgi:hypothetical protein
MQAIFSYVGLLWGRLVVRGGGLRTEYIPKLNTNLPNPNKRAKRIRQTFPPNALLPPHCPFTRTRNVACVLRKVKKVLFQTSFKHFRA